MAATNFVWWGGSFINMEFMLLAAVITVSGLGRDDKLAEKHGHAHLRLERANIEGGRLAEPDVLRLRSFLTRDFSKIIRLRGASARNIGTTVQRIEKAASVLARGYAWGRPARNGTGIERRQR